MNKKGFTLIELVMIIVILGILAAVAIPRYYDLSTDARLAVVDGSVGAIKSAAVIQYARTRGANTLATIVAATELENVTVDQTGGCNDIDAYHNGYQATTTRNFSISSTLCSG